MEQKQLSLQDLSLKMWILYSSCLLFGVHVSNGQPCSYKVDDPGEQIIYICENVKFADDNTLIFPQPLVVYNNYQKVLEIVNTSIPVLKLYNNVFRECANFTVVNISYADVIEVKSDAFTDFKIMESLYLTNNKIPRVDSTCFNSLGMLKYLDLSKNLITNIERDVFSKTKLLTLNISYNSLATLRTFVSYGLDDLEVLDVSYNDLSMFDLNFINEPLQVLTLSHNRINTILGRKNNTSSSLTNLTMSWNDIEHLQKDCFNNLEQLIHLDLSSNKLSSLPKELFSSSKRIRYLNLSDNSIKQLPTGIFDSVFYLQILDIYNNKLSYLKYDDKTWYNLVELNIQYNLINYIEVDSLVNQSVNLKYVNLDGNSFNCKYLLEVVQHFSLKNVTVCEGDHKDHENIKGNICYEEVSILMNYSKSLLVTVSTILVVIILLLILPWIVKYSHYLRAKRTRIEQLELL